MGAAAFPRVTEAETAAWLAVTCQATTEPCLSDVELAHLVAGARRADADGRAPSNAAWTPTYDLAWAAWKGWQLKASKATLMVDLITDGTHVSKSQVRQACLDMANQYARGVMQSVSLAKAPGGLHPTGLDVPGTTIGQDNVVLPRDLDDRLVQSNLADPGE